MSKLGNRVKAFTLIALGLAIAAMGVYVADADDAPGGAVTAAVAPLGLTNTGADSAAEWSPERGMVTSLMMRRDSGIVIAVTSNIAHANTSSLALRVGDAFAELTR